MKKNRVGHHLLCSDPIFVCVCITANDGAIISYVTIVQRAHITKGKVLSVRSTDSSQSMLGLG